MLALSHWKCLYLYVCDCDFNFYFLKVTCLNKDVTIAALSGPGHPPLREEGREEEKVIREESNNKVPKQHYRVTRLLLTLLSD